MARLELRQHGELIGSYELDAAELLIGRNKHCDIALSGKSASREHARLFRREGRYFIRDMQSINGVYVNSVRIFDDSRLRHGDVLQIGDYLLRFLEDTSPELSRDDQQAAARPEELHDEPDPFASSIVARLPVSDGLASSLHFAAPAEVKLAAMIEIASSLGAALTEQELLAKLLDSLLRIFPQADRGLAILQESDEAPLELAAKKVRSPHDDDRRPYSRTIVRRAMAERHALLSLDVVRDRQFDEVESIVQSRVRSLMCAPLVTSQGRVFGAIQLDAREHRERFNEHDLGVLASVANQAAIAVANARLVAEAERRRRLEQDLELARRLQQGFLPAGPPVVPGYAFFNYYNSAQQVGGDLYDYVELPGGRLAVVVADVAGKGVPAALVMARISSDVRYWFAREGAAGAALSALNRTFCHRAFDDRFVTLAAVVVDPQSHVLTIANAGHPPPLLRRGDGAVAEVGEQAAGPPIGVVDDVQYATFETVLHPQDVLLLYTDGFSEAINPAEEPFGAERIARTLGQGAPQPTSLGQGIVAALRDFTASAPQFDDMCLVCLGRR